MKKYSIIIVLVCMASAVFAQPKKFSALSKYEKRWALFHPFASYKIKKHQKEMYAAYNEVAATAKTSSGKSRPLLDTFANGGQLDAFRHTFAMAYFSKYVKTKKLRKLGKAHEKGNYLQFIRHKNEEGEAPDSLSSVMDLKNNEIGFSLQQEVKKLPVEELKQKVIQQIQMGATYIIKRNKKGLYVDCEGNIIDREKLKGWSIPKCLVASNL
jgi:hypothetical protein